MRGGGKRELSCLLFVAVDIAIYIFICVFENKELKNRHEPLNNLIHLVNSKLKVKRTLLCLMIRRAVIVVRMIQFTRCKQKLNC